MDAGSSQNTGCMIVVVGPSGAGKDTLIAHAADHFRDRDDIIFVRRLITRDSAAGGEDHESVSGEEFDALDAAGRFAVSWGAHGLRYGIPIETKRIVENGGMVVANGSRSALPHFHNAYSRLIVINITARPEVLAARLASRGRETLDDISRRLMRGNLQVAGDYEVITIDNSGSVNDAAKAMIDTLSSLSATMR